MKNADERHSSDEGSMCDIPLFTGINHNIAYLQSALHHCADMVYRSFLSTGHTQCCLLYVNGLVSSQQVDQDLVLPLSEHMRDDSSKLTLDDAFQAVVIASGAPLSTFVDVVNQVFKGQAILLVDGEQKALSFSVQQWAQRAVEEPGTESVIRGPREGFNENVYVSMSLVRRKLPTPDLKFEMMQIGTYSKTTVILSYIGNIADPKMIEEVRSRLHRIHIDGVLESGYIEELIEDSPFSPFPQIQNTERPDVVAAMLLEGRAAILVDGTPFALLMPVNFWGALTSPEDYYDRFMIATFIRWLRLAFAGVALFLPSLYVAVTTFHPEVLPMQLLLSVAAARENTPFPAMAEALMMEVTFEALREAGVRLPKTIGSAISIVGALVIGQAAVQAGVVSAPMVIIVAFTGIASFTVPRFNFAISLRMLRFPMIILAGTLGIAGIIIGLVAITIHVSTLRSFGVPYMSPLAPANFNNFKDTLVRVPWWAMRSRPMQNSKNNLIRQGNATSPNRRIPSDH